MTNDTSSTTPRSTADALGVLRGEIERIHVHNGEPSVRVIAARTSHAISHTTVHAVLRCKKNPTWGQLELVVEQLGGDVEHFRQLWISARNAERGLGDTTPDVAGADEEPVPDADGERGRGDQTQTVVLADTLQDFIDDLEKIGTGRPSGVSTGFTDLDRLLNGFGSGQLVIVAGRPAIGKSMFALSVARQATIRQEIPVLFMSFRSSKMETVRRFLSAEARVPLHVMHSGQLSDDDWTKLARSLGEIAGARLFINDEYAPTLSFVLAEARRLATEHDLGLLVVDSPQQLFEQSETATSRAGVTEVYRSLKMLALELRIPVVAVSTIPHEPTKKRTIVRPPLVEELNGAEEEADIVIIVHRDDFYDIMSPRAGEADLIVAKHRNGPTDTIVVAAQLHLSRFVDISGAPS